MKMLILALLSFNGFAESEKIRPGLWQMVTKVKTGDAPEVNLLKAMVDKVNSARPEQKVEFEKSLKALHIVNIDSEPANQVCYTEKQLEKLKDIMSKAATNKECEASDLVDTGTEMKSNVKCKDGSVGTVTLKYMDNQFEHTVDMVHRKKLRSLMTSKAVFLSPDCGQVKPQG